MESLVKLEASDPLDVAGRVYLVAGAGGGLAGALITALLERDARLVLMDNDALALEQVAATHHERAIAPFSGDISDPDALAGAIDLAIARFGRLDGGLNAAGWLLVEASDSLLPEQFRACLEANLTGAFLFSQALAPVLRGHGGGSIVHIASVSSIVSNPAYAAYAGSKAGLAQVVRVLGREWARDAIRVNAIGPALTETNLTHDYLANPAFRANAIRDIPMGRLGLPEDLVGPVLLLFGPGGAFITGQTVYVDGGRTLV